MPSSKVRAIIEKEFGGRKLNLEQVLYLKRYFGVSFAAIIFSDRYKLLQLEAAKKKRQTSNRGK